MNTENDSGGETSEAVESEKRKAAQVEELERKIKALNERHEAELVRLREKEAKDSTRTLDDFKNKKQRLSPGEPMKSLARLGNYYAGVREKAEEKLRRDVGKVTDKIAKIRGWGTRGRGNLDDFSEESD